jgi:hypothetical protein
VATGRNSQWLPTIFFLVNAESLRWRQTGLVCHDLDCRGASVVMISLAPRPVQSADGWSAEKRIPRWSMDWLKGKIYGWDSCTVLSPKMIWVLPLKP